MKSVILLRRRRVLWGTVMAACLLSGFILTTHSANVLWRSAAVPHVAQGLHFNPVASPNPESRIPNPGYGSAAQPRLAEAYGKLPLSFEVNKGQTDSRVKFLSRGSGYSLFLTGDEAVLSLRKSNSNGKRQMANGVAQGSHSNPAVLPGLFAGPEAHENGAAFPGFFRTPTAEFTDSAPATDCGGKDLEKPQGLKGEPCATQTTDALLRMRLVGANPNPKIVGMEELPGKSNYFIGSDPKKWRTNVPNYAKVKYANVYPGVDLVYYGNQGQLEYDFVVQPGADPGQVVLDVGAGLDPAPARLRPRLRGQDAHATAGETPALRVDANGDLAVGTDGGEVIFHKPVVYQPGLASAAGLSLVTLHSPLVEGRYRLGVDNQIHFELGRYDRRRPVVIDPVLAYSTFLGGSGPEDNLDFTVTSGVIAVDTSGNAYVTGLTASPDFPTTAGAFQIAFGGGSPGYYPYDAFVSKLNATGSALVYSTYLGGSGDDIGFGIAVDALGNAYATGLTASPDFPTTSGAFQTTIPSEPGNGAGFVSKLNAAGSALVYSTYLGGSTHDEASGIAVDASGNAYVTGSTTSFNFPTTPGAFQTAYHLGHGDAFVSKLNAVGSALIYSTFLGGSNEDGGSGIAIDASGNAYVTGQTNSTDFPTTPGAFQTTCCGAFVSKLNAAGSALIFSTYLDNSVASGIAGIAVNASGNAYVTGGGCTPWVGKLNATGSALIYSTSLGSCPDYDSGSGLGIAVDVSGNAYVTGWTASSSFPTTPGAFQTTFAGGKTDAFVAKITFSNAPVLALKPSTLPFLVLRTVGTASLPQTVKLTNVGSAQLDIAGITVTGPDPGDFAQSNNCPPTVASGGSCVITVTFTPKEQGVRTASVLIADSAPGSPQTVPLTGRGTFLKWSPRSLNMGDQKVGTSSVARTVTLTNTGSAPIAIFSIGIAGVNPGDFSETNDCGNRLNAGASCTIQVTFTPTAVGGRLGHVAIRDNAFGGTHSVGLLGKGT